MLSYPFIFKTSFGLTAQSHLWSAGFFILGLLIAGCALFTMADAGPAKAETIPGPAVHANAEAFDGKRFATWALLGFIPSGLLVSVTSYISTDIAAAPLLWVLPLALFLLTFVIAFRGSSLPIEDRLPQIQFWLAAFVLMSMTGSFLPLAGNLVLHLVLFFVSALICHRTLYNLRPQSSDLTLFYVAMSLGGVLGGMFSTFAGPLFFSTILEYPILVVAALFCNTQFLKDLRSSRIQAFVLPAIAGLALLLIVLIYKSPEAAKYATKTIAIAMLLFWRSAPRFAIAALTALAFIVFQPFVFQAESHRSFFGVHKIWELNKGTFRILNHDPTVYGAMRIRNDDGTPYTGKPQPTAYYAFEGPLGTAIQSIRDARGSLKNIFAIGQGVGTLACHRKDGETLKFFEIDAAVARIAGDASKFRFMKECAPDAQVVLGDARLTVAQQTGKADVIIVDAFSSDAIPVHLLTREAIGGYFSKLEPAGAVLVHVSSQTMDLKQIVARAAAEHGLVAYTRMDIVAGEFDKEFRLSSVVIALAKKPEHLGAMTATGAWKKILPDMTKRPWTDDYSTIIPAIAAKFRGE